LAISRCGKGSGIRVVRIVTNGYFVDKIRYLQSRYFRSLPPAGGKRGQKQRPVAQIDQAHAGPGLQQYCENVDRDGLLAFACRFRAFKSEKSRLCQ